MNHTLTSNNNNKQDSNVRNRQSGVDDDHRLDSPKAMEIADQTFEQLDPSTRSSLAEDRRAFEAARKRLIAANAKRDEAWRSLPKDVQKALADATRENPIGSTTEFLNLKPEEIPIQTFTDAVRARRIQLEARKFFYRNRAVCCRFLTDRFLSNCAGYSKLEVPFPGEEFQSKARVLYDLSFCDSVDDAMKTAKERWNVSRPCVVADRRHSRAARETKEEKQSRIRSVKRRALRSYARSGDWKKYASSFSTLVHVATVSGICVAVLGLAFLKSGRLPQFRAWIPNARDVRVLACLVATVAWIALACVYRNVVLLRLRFRSLARESKKEKAKGVDAKE